MASNLATIGLSLGSNGLPLGSQNNTFLKAQREFQSSLPVNERHRLTPCISVKHLLSEVEKFDIIAHKGPAGKKWLSIIQKFTDGVEPYFKIVDIFVSSHPEYAALFWGSLRLVLQIAGNYTSFFDKLMRLFESVTDTLPQYEELLELCVKQSRTTDDEANPNRMQNHIQETYTDIFRILHIVTGIFVKPDGRQKKAVKVAAHLIWKPFESRFNEILDRIRYHRAFVYQQLIIWHANETSKEIARTAAERDVDALERQDAAQERRLAEKARELERQERHMNERNRLEVMSRLDEFQKELRAIESQMLGDARDKIHGWISPPNYADRYDKALQLRADGTTRWLFEEKSYCEWRVESKERPTVGRRFGSRILWVQGHPGAGKTVLAASVIDELGLCEVSEVDRTTPKPPVYHYFYQHEAPESCRSSDAFRSLLSQILWKRRGDEHLLDQLTFLVDNRGQGQTTATDAELVDALHLCLEEDTAIVLDGIDECNDADKLVDSLLVLSHELPTLKILLLSRVNVPALNLSVLPDKRFSMPKAKITPDIHRFFMNKLKDMAEDGVLPQSILTNRNELAEKLCNGADGMFLWARLMIRCLSSPYITKDQRLRMIHQVNVPEGLESMYERIVTVIRTAGPMAIGLASKALTWLAFSIVPLTSRQLQQAIATQESRSSTDGSGDVVEFQTCIIMACAGLIELTTMESNPECPQGESALRFYHLSLHEMIQGFSGATHSHASLIDTLPLDFNTPSRQFETDFPRARNLEVYPSQRDGSTSPIFQQLVTIPTTSHLVMAACCLQQLLYHTPGRPLSGHLKGRVSEAQLNDKYCFTSYASVHWISHLERSSRLSEDFPLPAQSTLMDVVKVLSAFLAQPRVLSAWLEAFYTSRYQRGVVRCTHPPLQIVCDWVDMFLTMSSSRQVWLPQPIRDVQATTRALSFDVEHITKVWDTQLEKTPELVWDEMTYFAKSKFFFSPMSIKISIQEPEAPKCQGLTEKPVAKMSKTSMDGNIKSILSIWAPVDIRDRHKFTKLRVDNRNRYSNILDLCSGWIATYHVWKLKIPDEPFAKVQMHLDAGDVLGPLRKYLDYPITDGLDFPLAISDDAMTIGILKTLYTIQPSKGRSDSKILSRRLGEKEDAEPDFLWTAPDGTTKATNDSYNLYFSHSGQFLLLHETIQEFTQLIVYECLRGGREGFDIAEVNRLDISTQAKNIAHFCFHPSRALLIFSTTITIDVYRKERTLVAWRFKSGRNNIERLPLANSWSPKSISISSCGGFLVIQRDFPANAQPEVIKCPDALPEDDAVFNSASDIDSANALKACMEPDGGSGALRQRTAGLGLQPFQNTAAVNRLTEVATSRTGTEVSLAQKTDNGVETNRIVTLPQIVQFDGIVHTAIEPQPGEDMFMVSVDMDRRSHYSLLDDNDGAYAAVIERHRAYAAADAGRARINTLDVGDGTHTLDQGASVGSEWKTIQKSEGQLLLRGSQSSHDQISISPTEPMEAESALMTMEDMPTQSQGRSRLKHPVQSQGQQSASTTALRNVQGAAISAKPDSQSTKAPSLLYSIARAPIDAFTWLMPK
ncbi:hypothetical protein S7711_07922 [Stachybotrys chartarum IBT 7711]|uniref:NACHT domain-containing protein n=1 Tax=Stachybotrys chartarum (strain CBS 109288 / IBT 7711) TaxID=1280523 RepID=A0A084B5X9_STACB|nr:hypothetical protein S7711_07922 [Stachybotrys chartarum IBT 7711]